MATSPATGEHSTRHHATNRAWRDACAAVAIGAVLLGDKEKADEYKQYNADHVADIVQPGASAWHTDWLGETKVASAPLHLSLRPADCTGHVVPGARPCALGTFSYLVSSTSYFRLSYPNRLL